VDLFFFDFDRTLYAYDSSRRLPAQSRLTGVSQYDLAKRWWVAGYETRAETGEWPTSAEYLAKFTEITGAKLTLDEWAAARHEASSPNPGVVETLRRVADLGTVSLLSNNPAPFVDTLPQLAPDVSEILHGNVLVSCALGVRKPAADAFGRALEHYGARAADAFFVDDSAENVAGAAALGITTHHFTGFAAGKPADSTSPAVIALNAAVDRFIARKRT
jgi:putative hydrolase of the HAD superfamily